jgi:hypothetical protein
MVRATDEAGNNLPELTFSPEKALAGPGSSFFAVWYRIPVPASATGVELPKFARPYTAWYNGAPVRPDAGGHIAFPAAAEGAKNVLTMKLETGDEFQDAPRFTLGRAKNELGSWLDRGLTYYSGSAAYEKEFTLPAGYAGRKLTLDCGEVGVVAEVWVNNQPAGTRVWMPYSVDISKLVRAGKNRVKIIVTNTMEAERAVENHASQLPRLRHSGLLGPVRVVDGGPAI